jgi:predicted PurR-regulated permease PerM
MLKNRFFTICYGIILVLLIVWLMNEVQFIFIPLVIAFQTLFFPFLIAGVLFYLFRPLIELLANKNVPRILAILLLYLSLIGIIVALSLIIGPILQQQVNRLIDNTPQIAKALRQQWEIFELNRATFPQYVKDLIDVATIKAQEIISDIGRNLSTIIGVITNIVVILVIVPFILFYLLKDGKKAPDQLLGLLPKGQIKEGKAILSDMNKALSTYVQGQVIVSLCVGIMIYIGYLIIGIEYSLILALIAMLTNVIPFVGPFIGIIPALIVGFIESPMMLLKVIIVVVIAQQIESNLISPQIMGRALDVHPLTIILLLLVASSLGGVLGLILAVPTYAMLKVVVNHSYRLFRLRSSE